MPGFSSVGGKRDDGNGQSSDVFGGQMPDFILSGEVFDFVRLPAVRLENTASVFFLFYAAWFGFYRRVFDSLDAS